MKHFIAPLKVITALAALASLTACTGGALDARAASSVETAYYNVPIPPYTRTIFSTTNF